MTGRPKAMTELNPSSRDWIVPCLNFFSLRGSLYLFCAIVAIANVFPTGTFATTYHVDVSRGNDGYSGSENEPFRTIRRACTDMEPGDRTVIHEGIYHEQIMGGKSGREDAPITYEGTDAEKVILRGSKQVKDWRKVGNVWMKDGLRPSTPANAFVMVDELRKLEKLSSPLAMGEGTFYLSPDGIYSIRLWGDANPNTDHTVEVYGLDLAFYAGERWGATAKKWITLRNMTIEKYGAQGVVGIPQQHQENAHWELDRVIFRYNNGCGVFVALDDWYIHDCKFIKNAIHGCQICGARVRFENNLCKENEWFSHSGYGGMGLLIGGEEQAQYCIVRNNFFENDGYADGYGCGIYLEGRTRNNLIENNFIIGSQHGGVCFYGGSDNTVINNVLVNISPQNAWALTAAFVVSHSREGAPTQSVGNLIAHNTVWRCAAPVAVEEPIRKLESLEMNKFVNNLFYGCRIMLPVPKQKIVVLEKNGWFSCPQGQGSKTGSLDTALKDLAKGYLKDGFKALDSSPITGRDPRLKNPSGKDFYPMSDSPLIDAGAPLESVRMDKDGNKRPTSPLPAIGAYEYSDAPGERTH